MYWVYLTRNYSLSFAAFFSALALALPSFLACFIPAFWFSLRTRIALRATTAVAETPLLIYSIFLLVYLVIALISLFSSVTSSLYCLSFSLSPLALAIV